MWYRLYRIGKKCFNRQVIKQNLQESIARLRQAKDEDIASLEAIATLLDGIPEAVDIAANCLRHTSLSPATYLDIFLKKQEEVLRQGISSEEYPILVAASISLQLIEVESAGLLAFLLPFGFWAADDFPVQAFEAGVEHLPEHLSAVIKSPKAIQSAFKIAVSFSLLRLQEGSVFIPHPAIQAAIRRKLSREHQLSLARFVLFWLSTFFSRPPATQGSPSLHIKLLPHLQAAGRHFDFLGGEPEGVARTKLFAGDYFLECGRLIEAKELLLGAAACLPTPSENADWCVKSLMKLAGALGEPTQKNIAVYQAALKLSEAQGLKARQAEALNYIGEAHTASEDRERAKESYERAFALSEGELDFCAAQSAQGLFMIALTQQDFPEAKRWLEQMQRCYEAQLGADDPITAGALLSYALLIGRHDIEEAAKASRKALALLEGRHEPKLFSFAPILTDVAAVLNYKGEVSLARRLLEKSADLYEREGQVNDPEYGLLLHRLSAFLFAAKDKEGAKEMLSRAVTILQAQLGDEHPNTTKAKEHLELLLDPELDEYEDEDDEEPGEKS